MTLLVISNGAGEDLISGHLIDAFLEQNPNLTFKALPLVGHGHAYIKRGLTPLYNNRVFPSGGFIRNIGDLWRDIRAGALTQALAQRRLIQSLIPSVEGVLCVGDIFSLWMGGTQQKRPTIFLPTAKSDTFMPHSDLERRVMKRHAQLVFPRDQLTTTSLQQHGVPAHFHGNPMMDKLHASGLCTSSTHKGPILGLLPGSRDEAYANFATLLILVTHLLDKHIDLHPVAAIPPSLDKDRLATIAKKVGWTLDSDHLHRPNTSQTILLSTHFNDVITHSRLLIGLAGTANEQALHLNKPVICFPGAGPQTTLKRFQEQQQLCGNHLHIVEDPTPDRILETVQTLLNQPEVPPPPPQKAAQAIVSTVLTQLFSG